MIGFKTQQKLITRNKFSNDHVTVRIESLLTKRPLLVRRISYDIYKKLKETATEYVIVLHFIEKETKRKEKKKKKNTRECEKSVSTIPLLGRYCIDVTVNISIKNSNAHKILHR